MFMTFTLFPESFNNIVTITFSSLILIEMLNVISEVTKLTKLMLLSIIISFGLYMISIVVFREYFQTDYIDW
jgi:phospholipid-translocating ATPase